jgi:FKBP-type peptidyl-prolyl cis-trans isomerase
MKRHLSIALALGALVCAAGAQTQTNIQVTTQTNIHLNNNPPAAPPKTDFSQIFKTDKEKFSYAIGMSYAENVKGKLTSFDLDYDPDEMAKAFVDYLKGTPMLITPAQEKEIFGDLNAMISAKRAEKQKMQAEKGLAEGAAFLAKNKGLPDVVTLPSGLQYKVLTPGDGPIPKASDEVVVTYRGTFIDGSEFDSSAKHGGTFTTHVQGGIIKGWTEALLLMKTGAKWQIVVPSDLAYGPAGRGSIPPNTVLIFEIGLESIKPTAAAAPTPAPEPNGIHAPPPAVPLTSDIIKVPSAEEMKKGAKIETLKPEDVERERAKAATNQ